MKDYSPEAVYCERPTYMPGRAAAASGSFEKLCMLTGRFMEVVYRFGIPFIFVPVRDWMGQMTDVAIRHRVGRILGEEFTKSIPAHAIDAVGIGLHVLGRWQNVE
jgi:hypothetical protein